MHKPSFAPWQRPWTCTLCSIEESMWALKKGDQRLSGAFASCLVCLVHSWRSPDKSKGRKGKKTRQQKPSRRACAAPEWPLIFFESRRACACVWPPLGGCRISFFAYFGDVFFNGGSTRTC